MATDKLGLGRKGCPLSSVKGKDGKYARKVKVGGKCVNPTSANINAAFKAQKKSDKLRENVKRGPEATKTAAKKARALRVGVTD